MAFKIIVKKDFELLKALILEFAIKYFDFFESFEVSHIFQQKNLDRIPNTTHKFFHENGNVIRCVNFSFSQYFPQ